MFNAFIAAVIGSEKNTGSTRSTMSPETSRKFRLFSSGISALRAPLSIATCNGSAKDRIALIFPWMLRSPRITRPAWTGSLRGVDGGFGQRVIADRDVAVGVARDSRQRVVANRDIAAEIGGARARQGIGAGAFHRLIADGDVVSTARDIFSGVIAHRGV